MSEIEKLRQTAYTMRVKVEHLRREVFKQTDPNETTELSDELIDAETALVKAQSELAAALEGDPGSGVLVEIDRGGGPSLVLGAETTGLTAQVHLRMAQVPTSIYHLLDSESNPLVSCTVTNHSDEIRRLRITSSIEGYSAKAINTLEVNAEKSATLNQLPSLFPDRLLNLNELTRASLSVLVEDLDGNIVESHSSHPVWLLARTSAPLAVQDPKTGEWQDFSPYLGAFVTPNSPSLMAFLRSAAELHPQKRLVGYQGDKSALESQVQAIFESLKLDADITYVNSVIAFSPDQGAANQRVRLPRESLSHKQANCIDGTVLFASLLEGVSLSPGLALVPGHAFVAWETWNDETAEWRYLETTMIGSHSFDEARTSGEASAKRYKTLAEKTGKPEVFKLWPLKDLRAQRGITPME